MDLGIRNGPAAANDVPESATGHQNPATQSSSRLRAAENIHGQTASNVFSSPSISSPSEFPSNFDPRRASSSGNDSTLTNPFPPIPAMSPPTPRDQPQEWSNRFETMQPQPQAGPLRAGSYITARGALYILGNNNVAHHIQWSVPPNQATYGTIVQGNAGSQIQIQAHDRLHYYQVASVAQTHQTTQRPHMPNAPHNGASNQPQFSNTNPDLLPHHHGHAPHQTPIASQSYSGPWVHPAQPGMFYNPEQPAQPCDNSAWQSQNTSTQVVPRPSYSASPGATRPSKTSKQIREPAFDERKARYKHISLGNWQASQCNGNKRALLIGINYTRGSVTPLKTCTKDATEMADYLMKYHGFPRQEVTVLVDKEGVDEEVRPTRANIIKGMNWLVEGAQANDSLFFYFSGHGSQVKDEDGDEEDGWDETILPVDYEREQENHIVDDEMHERMVLPLPLGTRLTAIFDCCCSGTALDLPWIYGIDGKREKSRAKSRLFKDVVRAFKKLFSPDTSVFREVADSVAEASARAHRRDKAFRTKAAQGDVVMISATKDGGISRQTGYGGVLSNAFRHVLKTNHELSYSDLLRGIQEFLRDGGHLQEPQLSSCHPLGALLVVIFPFSSMC